MRSSTAAASRSAANYEMRSGSRKGISRALPFEGRRSLPSSAPVREINNMSAPTFDLKKALAAHEGAIRYAVRLQRASSTKADSGETLVALSALSVLAHEAVCLHRAIEVLATEGWAFGAPILMRSMLDLALSALVIVNADRPDVAAFEYLYAFTKSDDYQSNPAAQKEAQESVDKHMKQMTPADREQAAGYLASTKSRPYWYSDRFSNPRAVIQAYGSPELEGMWRRLSSATHGGYIGMRMFRDDPFRLDINPRKDPRAAAFVLVGSTRLLIEMLHVWEHFLGGWGPEYEGIKLVIQAAGISE